MKKNTNIGILALVVLDAIANALNEKTSTSIGKEIERHYFFFINHDNLHFKVIITINHKKLLKNIRRNLVNIII